MIKKYAFPIGLHSNGLTKREYFAARAPAEPQTWFKQMKAAKPPEPPREPLPDNVKYPALEKDLKYLRDWLRDPCFDPEIQGFDKWISAWNKYWVYIRNADAEALKCFYTEWPWAWADAVLAAGKEVP